MATPIPISRNGLGGACTTLSVNQQNSVLCARTCIRGCLSLGLVTKSPQVCRIGIGYQFWPRKTARDVFRGGVGRMIPCLITGRPRISSPNHCQTPLIISLHRLLSRDHSGGNSAIPPPTLFAYSFPPPTLPSSHNCSTRTAHQSLKTREAWCRLQHPPCRCIFQPSPRSTSTRVPCPYGL